jgi:hypothetical protein
MKTLTLALGILTLCGTTAWGRTSDLSSDREPKWIPINAPVLNPEGRANINDGELVDEIYSRLWQNDDSIDLSFVKVVALGGRVTLQGQAVSMDDSRMIEQIATDVAGRGNVTNELVVQQR